jgi:hypothetical protein
MDIVIVYGAGLHGAAVAISGRRQQVLDDAVAAFKEEGITAIGLQVCHRRTLAASATGFASQKSLTMFQSMLRRPKW